MTELADALPTVFATSGATFAQRLARRAGDRPFAACAGIDPSPQAVELITTNTIGPARVTRAAAMECFAGMVIEAVRDNAPAVKLQLAWFETAGAPGFRALERVLEFARRADMLVVIDGKRGDVPHSAAAYADAWLGERAERDRKSTRLNSSHMHESRMPSSA